VRAHAEDDGEIRDVRSGQELTERERLGKLILRHPAFLDDERAMHPRDGTAKREHRDFKKGEEDLAAGWMRR
jgi:hypothetical protein